MKLSANIQITGLVEITDQEADMLEFLTSYELAKSFAAKYSTKYTEENIRETLSKLREQLHKIIAAKKAATDAVLPSSRRTHHD